MNYTNASSPNTVLNWPSSYSTWVAITGSRVLVAYNSSDSNFNLGDAGGTANVAPHNHQWYNFTSGSAQQVINCTGGSNGYGSIWNSEDPPAEVTFTTPLKVDCFTNIVINSNTTNGNYPPYLVAAMWRRTA
jgi:hypothetical protein